MARWGITKTLSDRKELNAAKLDTAKMPTAPGNFCFRFIVSFRLQTGNCVSITS
jgi:hypothetical protein